MNGYTKKYQQDVFGNRRKGENSLGDPPQRAKDALKEKEGWDWDANARKADTKKVATGTVVVGGAYVVYRVVRMIPSLAPPLWWTIPEDLAIP